MTFSAAARAAMQKIKRDVSGQLRDWHGRWSGSGGGRVMGGVGGLTSMIARIDQADGGFTYQPLTDSEPVGGFAVSPYPHLSFAKPVNEFTLGDLARYVKKNRRMFNNPDHFIGAWHDPVSKKIFLDISVVKRSAGEAHKLAAQHDQIAYFDLGRGKSVTVNRAATSGGAA